MKQLMQFGLALATALSIATQVNAQERESQRLGKLLAECLAAEIRLVMSGGWELPHKVDARLEMKCGFLEERERGAFAEEFVTTIENEPSPERRRALAILQLSLRDKAKPRTVVVSSYAKLLEEMLAKQKSSKPRSNNSQK